MATKSKSFAQKVESLNSIETRALALQRKLDAMRDKHEKIKADIVDHNMDRWQEYCASNGYNMFYTLDDVLA